MATIWKRYFSALLVLVLGLAAREAAALPSCELYRAELSRLQGAYRSYAPEISRLNLYRQQIGCLNNDGFFSTPNPACGAIDQRIRYLLANASENDAVLRRRRELGRLVRAACSTLVPAQAVSQRAYGGSKLICVRSCDGAFFPLDASMRRGVDPDDYCQALCPGTEAAAYSMPPRDDGLKDAAALHSKRAYSALANAFLFQKKRVAACSCAVEDRPWSSSLLKAEDYLTHHRRDVIVTADLADKLSRPDANMAKILASRSFGKFEVAQPNINRPFEARENMQLRYAHSEISRHRQKPVVVPETPYPDTRATETVVQEKAGRFSLQSAASGTFSDVR